MAIDLAKSIFIIDELDSQKRLKQVNHDRFYMQKSIITMVGRSLIKVRYGRPNTVTSYDKLTFPKMLRESELEPMTNKWDIVMFLLTPLKDRYMVSSGGL